MMQINKDKIRGRFGIGFGLTTIALMVGVAYASNGSIQDRRVSLSAAQSLAERAQRTSEIPIVVNDLVLKQLNRYIGTPEGRDFMKLALQRMENYRAVIGAKLGGYAVPMDLMAVPIIESGYLNLSAEESGNPMSAAGLWQFIPPTALRFGLRVVKGGVDDRLDVPLATDAAIRYLLSNKLRFNDWYLSLLAYNMGETRLQAGIDATGTRDAWTLIRKGFEGDKDYLAKLIAVIIIMRNPDSIN